jgi:hypothetical protein
MTPGTVLSGRTSEQIEAALDQARVIMLDLEGGLEIFGRNHPQMIGGRGVGAGV